MKKEEGKKPENVTNDDPTDRRTALKRIASALSGAAVMTFGAVLIGDRKEASGAYASWRGYSAYASWDPYSSTS
jgi:hypothetical protein